METEEQQYNETWYTCLSPERKKEALRNAIYKCPSLAEFMRAHKVRASDPTFTDHFTFKLMMDILGGK